MGSGDIGYNYLAVNLGSKGVQNINGTNDWVPALIAGRQYPNMSTDNVLPLYYSQYALVNPGAGKVKAKDFILVVNGTEYSLASVINQLHL